MGADLLYWNGVALRTLGRGIRTLHPTEWISLVYSTLVESMSKEERAKFDADLFRRETIERELAALGFDTEGMPPAPPGFELGAFGRQVIR